MEEDIFDNLPDDPGQAFVFLERYFKGILDSNTVNTGDESVIQRHRTIYINTIIDIARHFDIVELKSDTKPIGKDLSWDDFYDFERRVGSVILQIGLKRSKNRKIYSTSLSVSDKEKIRHYISLIKIEIDKSDIAIDKKDAIFKKLAELELEIDRDRTRFEVLAEKVVAVARLSGDVEREGARPWWHWVMLLLGQVDAAKEAETRNLPPPAEQKRLEPPKKTLPKP